MPRLYHLISGRRSERPHHNPAFGGLAQGNGSILGIGCLGHGRNRAVRLAQLQRPLGRTRKELQQRPDRAGDEDGLARTVRLDGEADDVEVRVALRIRLARGPQREERAAPQRYRHSRERHGFIVSIENGMPLRVH